MRLQVPIRVDPVGSRIVYGPGSREAMRSARALILDCLKGVRELQEEEEEQNQEQEVAKEISRLTQQKTQTSWPSAKSFSEPASMEYLTGLRFVRG